MKQLEGQLTIAINEPRRHDLILPEALDNMITLVLIEEQAVFERVPVSRGAVYKILDNGQHVGTISAIPGPTGDGWNLKESFCKDENGAYTLNSLPMRRVLKKLWAEFDRLALTAARQQEHKMVVAGEGIAQGAAGAGKRAAANGHDGNNIRTIIKDGYDRGLTDIQIGYKIGLGDSRVKQIRLEMGLKRRTGRRKN
jgi:hypothetical protein